MKGKNESDTSMTPRITPRTMSDGKTLVRPRVGGVKHRTWVVKVVGSKQCTNCKRVMPVPKGREVSKRFCSTYCRVMWWVKNKRKV